MLAPLPTLLLAAAAAAGTLPDSVARDSTASPRIVRTLEPVEVVGDRFSDLRSIETVQHVSAGEIRQLAVDRLVDAIGTQAGVVVTGEDLHVRGGRTGELVTTIAGVSLNEPRRGTPMEVPLLAVQSADLLTGGLDADHEGSLAGELDLETVTPGPRPAAIVRWQGDGLLDTGYDAAHVRASAPIARTGLGLAIAGEARLDDLGLPITRSRGRTNILGATFGWRQDNHLLGWAKLAPVRGRQRASLEVLVSRVVRQPYDPMFDYDGWVSFTPYPPGILLTGQKGDDSSFRYRAGDHVTMTEERRFAAIATFAGGTARAPQRFALGWTRESALQSIGLRHDDAYVNDQNRPTFGPYDYPQVDPFHAYAGDEPYFRDTGSSKWFARADASRPIGHGHRLRFGAGAFYEYVRLNEIDDAEPVIPIVNERRTYSAWAPGSFAYVQHRWEYSGLVWNAGLRVSSFTAGPQAQGEFKLPFQRTAADDAYRAPTIWSWAPRLGFSYPMSDRDAFSLSYSRVFQDPPRDLLYDDRILNYDRHPLGNGRMVPAEVISYQMAIKHALDRQWSLQIAAFSRDLYAQPGTRLIEPMAQYYLLQYASEDDAHANGFELSVARNWAGHQQLELSYTYMNAWGTQSNLEGIAYGTNRGERPVPLGEHPLDWDQRHAIAGTLLAELGRDWRLSWSTRVASGLPWTPLNRTQTLDDGWAPLYADESLLNSRRLPWSENTNLALRFEPPIFFGLAAMLSITNVFDNRTDRLVTIPGYPNPKINTLYDEYSAYYTETGLRGGAYWNDANGDGLREWVPVNDPRLRNPQRTIRFGVEFSKF